MRRKILGSSDYRDDMISIIEAKRLTNQAGNLLLNMLYKIEDSYDNYRKVKREVLSKDEFIEGLISYINNYCNNINILEVNNENFKLLKEDRIKIKEEASEKSNLYVFPSEKDLVYGITKAEVTFKLRKRMTLEEKAILTTIGIGKCISRAEVLRDFNGWSWSINKTEVESTECNIVYNLLVFLLGVEFVDSLTSVEDLKENLPPKLYEELLRVSMQFYRSYDKNQNEKILQILATYKNELLKMKYPYEYQQEIKLKADKAVNDLNHIDYLLSNQLALKNEFVLVNAKLPENRKIFSISTYHDLLLKSKQNLENQITEYAKIQDPYEFEKIKEELKLKIKYYEVNTDISKFEKSFLECFEKRVERAFDKKEVYNLIYITRYLNFIPNCKMKLNKILEKLIPKAIEFEIFNSISNNDEIDYRILRGIFDIKEINMEDLSIKLSTRPDIKGIVVDLYNLDNLEKTYIANTPEESEIEIKTSKRTKVFVK